MKISELTTENAVDVLCQLTPYVSNIVSDEDLLAELKTSVKADEVATKAEWLALGAAKVNKLVPIVLKKRKADVFGILAVVNNKTEEEIAKQNILATMKQIREIIKDKELLDFFKSCVGSEGSE